MNAGPEQVSSRWIWLAAGLLLAGSVLCVATFGREAYKQARRASLQKNLEQQIKLNQTELDEIAARVRPLVVEVAGADFISEPLIRIANRNELGDSLIADISAISKRRGIMETDLNVGFASALQVLQTQTMLLARYSPSARTILIVPENFPQILAAFDVPPDQLREIVTLVVAHELVHALQDQHRLTLDLMADCPNLDACSALAAVMEGQSMVVEREIAMRFGSEKASNVLRKIVVSTPQGIGCQPTEAGSLRQKLYEQGDVAMGRRYRFGGPAGMWNVFDNLPASLMELQGDATKTP